MIYARSLLAVLLLASISAFADGWSLKDKDGVRYTLSGLQGRWVLVNFWAPWCPTCLQEIPEFVSLQKQHKDLQVIGVAVMYKNRREVTDIAQSQAISYPVVFGSEDTAADFGGMVGMPTSFLYTPSGKLVGKHSGPLTQNEIEQAIEGKAAALFTR
ncbi:MAG: TlpA disulfide reductase family protein [Proteobacteria bacterium]|nr:TlpA disulfide reductase family protein [Pseudomonadota bacterium]